MTDRARDAARVERFYGRYARSRRKRRAWAADNAGNAAMRSELLAALLEELDGALRGGGDVLDVGCGGGFWLEALAGHGIAPERLHGVDLLDARVRAASERVPGAHVARADATALPHPAGRFAAVLLFTVLSSLPGRAAVERAAAEARRVTAPGGVVLVYEPRVPNPLNPETRVVRRSELEAVLGPAASSRSLTVVPALARRLPATAYGALARVPALRTHRLLGFRSSA